jgi:hypothetical protein
VRQEESSLEVTYDISALDEVMLSYVGDIKVEVGYDMRPLGDVM